MPRALKALLLAAAVALVGVVLSVLPPGIALERKVGLAALFHLRGPQTPPPDVAVIAIDDQTGGQLGLSNLPREWPRSIHGRLVDRLVERGAAAIAFDFDFQLPKQAEDDAAFAAALGAAKRVVLAEKLSGKRQPLTDAQGRPRGSVWIEKLLMPTPALANAARGLGAFPLPKVEVAVHEFWAFKPSVGGAPTMPAVTLQVLALPAYRHWCELQQRAGAPWAARLPAPPGDTAPAEVLRDFMRNTRALANQEPAIVAALRAPSGEWSARERMLLRGLAALYGGDDHRLLNFYGPPGTITTVPYHLVAGSAAADAGLPDLHGKAVFVGFSDLYDPGQPDRFYTVYTNRDGVDLSGVEIAATAFANLLADASLDTPGGARELAIVAAFGAVTAALLYLLPAIAGVPVTLVLAGAYGVAAWQAFGARNLVLPLAIPLLVQLPLGLFAGLLLHYLAERRKKARATKAIGLYLPEHLARDFTAGNFDPADLNRVTYGVCFASDMAGFTSIAEQLKPEELAVFLNDYFESLAEPLRRQRVDVIEFRADGIMCAWTADGPGPEVHSRAVTAAVEALETIDRFRLRHAHLSQSLRIGLETGTVYVGHAGGGGHYVYSIVGDCANTAARIESLNKHLGTQLLASRSALAGVTGVLTRFVGEFRFVGKSEPLPVHEILAAAVPSDHPRAVLAARFEAAMSDLAGRDWLGAAAAFEGILRDYPDDGPSRYHLERCRRFAAAPPAHAPWIVYMDAK